MVKRMLLFIKNYHKGYTLSEVLIVLLLLGILSSLTIPNFKQLLLKARQQQDREQLLNAIHFARASALLLQNEVVMCPLDALSPCGKNWQQGFAIWHCVEADCTQLRQFQLFDSSATLTSTRSALRFFANGFAAGSNLRLRYHASYSNIDFIVNNEGRVRME